MPVTGRPLLSLTLALACCACDLGPPVVSDQTGGPVALVIEPDAGPNAIVDLIASARASVWAEMYLLTDAGAVAALTGRARAGCDVRVILEPAPYQNEDGNQTAFAELAAAGVVVRWSTPRFSYTHAKALIVDHARLAVLTLNLTGAGLGGNREYAAIDDDPDDVAAAEAVFAADETGADADRRGPGRLVTSPDDSRAIFTTLIDGARVALAVETEELTDPGVVSALMAARDRGVALTLVWPGPPDAGSAFAKLAAAGATVRAVEAPAIHAKVVVADGHAVYLGSANFTPTSLDRNREIGLRLEDVAIGGRIAATVADDAARGVSP